MVGSGSPARPERCRFRRSTTLYRRSPRSRTVVTPAANCRRSPSVITASSSSSLYPATRSKAPIPLSVTRWTWVSISPGRTVPSGWSITRQPSGASGMPGSTPTIRPSSIRTVAPPLVNRSPSNIRAARIASMRCGLLPTNRAVNRVSEVPAFVRHQRQDDWGRTRHTLREAPGSVLGTEDHPPPRVRIILSHPHQPSMVPATDTDSLAGYPCGYPSQLGSRCWIRASRCASSEGSHQ